MAIDDPGGRGDWRSSPAELGVAAVFGIAERTHHDTSYITQVVRRARPGRGRAAQAPSRRGRGRVPRGRRRRGVRARRARASRSRSARRAESTGRSRTRVRRRRRWCASARRPVSTNGARREDEWRAGWEWWLSAGLADAQRHARERRLWIAIATQAGSTVDEDFPGLAALVDPRGEVVAQLADWQPGTSSSRFR